MTTLASLIKKNPIWCAALAPPQPSTLGEFERQLCTVVALSFVIGSRGVIGSKRYMTDALDWFTNPTPEKRGTPCDGGKTVSADIVAVASQMRELLSLPEADVAQGLRQLDPQDLLALQQAIKKARFSVAPIGKPLEPTMDQIAADVTRTWALVAASPLEPTGVAFFLKIFEIAPGALQLFSFKNEPNLAQSPKLKSHALKVMQTVDVAVKGLADLDRLVPVLQGLGKKHVPYGVLPAHYDVVGQALLATLEGDLGAEWTPRVRDAWIAVYGVVSTTMIGDNYA